MFRPAVLVSITLLLLALAACDLRHARERAYCLSADGDAEKCRARPEWCTTTGGPRCEGGQGCSGVFCVPGEAGEGCVVDEAKRRARCPLDDRFVRVGGVVDLSRYRWKLERLSPLARELSGQRLGEQEVAALGEADRRELCGSVHEPCELVWDGAKARASCALVGDPCAGCARRDEPYRCIPRNLCNGVICP